MKGRLDFKTDIRYRQDIVQAACQECGWSTQARNGHGIAAQHHYRTGHTVVIEKEVTISMEKAVNDK